MLLRQDLARLASSLATVAEGRTPLELIYIADHVQAELQHLRNGFVNKYANPATRRKLGM